ncbi:MAG TPA: hypothetical protein VGM86_27205 [Thermoanaerobaculia bacterium]|jgi:hypothetical protein
MNNKTWLWSVALIGALAAFVFVAYGLLAPGQYNAVFSWLGGAKALIAVAVVGLLTWLLSGLVHQRKEAH